MQNLIQELKRELLFVRSLIVVNVASAMEYRVSFISQVVGMALNNGIYFVFWLIFFDKFGNVRGYELVDVYMVYAIAACSFGLAFTFAGNAGPMLATLIAQGRIDYYAVFPRRLLPHVIFSRMSTAAIGDILFGIIAFLFTGYIQPLEIVLFILTVLMAALIFAAFGVTYGSLAFFMGNADQITGQALNSMITFAIYPQSLFTGTVRVILYTLVPSAFVGSVPAAIIQDKNVMLLSALVAAVVVSWTIATFVFYTGMRRYESGSAINVNM